LVLEIFSAPTENGRRWGKGLFFETTSEEEEPETGGCATARWAD
jgi:hypothetical protein